MNKKITKTCKRDDWAAQGCPLCDFTMELCDAERQLVCVHPGCGDGRMELHPEDFKEMYPKE